MQKTFTLTVRLPKKDSSILYFSLESNESLVFYSTLSNSLKQGYRDIQLTGSIEFKTETYRLIEFLKKDIELSIFNESQS